jgi:hypothetical protein
VLAFLSLCFTKKYNPVFRVVFDLTKSTKLTAGTYHPVDKTARSNKFSLFRGFVM